MYVSGAHSAGYGMLAVRRSRLGPITKPAVLIDIA